MNSISKDVVIKRVEANAEMPIAAKAVLNTSVEIAAACVNVAFIF